jgi:hypothetical protein
VSSFKVFAHHRVVQSDTANADGLAPLNGESVSLEEALGAETDFRMQFNDVAKSGLPLQVSHQRITNAPMRVLGGDEEVIDQSGRLQIGIASHSAVEQRHEGPDALDPGVPCRDIIGCCQPCLAPGPVIVITGQAVYRRGEHLAKQGFVSGDKAANPYRFRWHDVG